MKVPGFLLRERLTVEPHAGQTGAGGATFGAPVQVRAHVEPKRRVLRGPNGEEVVSEVIAYTRPEVSAPPRSRVTWHGRTLSVLTDGEFRDAYLELALGEEGQGGER